MTLRHPLLRAASAAAALLGAAAAVQPLAAAESRTISLRNIHTEETLTVEYKRNGRYLPEAMKQINWIMRDWRKDEATQIDPALIDLLWEVHSELGSKEPINIISAFRSRATNEMLRKTVGGQAKESRHITGQAADVQFPDVPLKHLRYSALIRERGGVGYYPTSATPFVHLDTDRVRSWPRLPRHELALLFRNGRTQHVPVDGEPITPEDVSNARQSQAELAVEIAQFHELRQRPKTAVLLASAGGSARPQPAPLPTVAAPAATPMPVTAHQPQRSPSPKLVAEPRLAERPDVNDRRALADLASLAAMPQLVSGPTLATRPRPVASTAVPAGRENASEPGLRLASLSSGGLLAPVGRFAWAAAWLRAPAYDEEHPEEDAYRPLPIAPFLTASASPDQSMFLATDRRGAGADGDQASLPRLAELLWAQEFDGEAAALSAVVRVAVEAAR
ncbi:MAG TPA: DUF882 domain-containing protein [Hyphomicrobiaceae bacterium]|nr:DUF882 domain-containing protein [Hyphomicrobiaceae bacterium]